MGPIVLIAIGILFLAAFLARIGFSCDRSFLADNFDRYRRGHAVQPLARPPASTPAPPVQPHFVETTRE